LSSLITLNLGFWEITACQYSPQTTKKRAKIAVQFITRFLLYFVITIKIKETAGFD
jgi:hypothetical protein